MRSEDNNAIDNFIILNRRLKPSENNNFEEIVIPLKAISQGEGIFRTLVYEKTSLIFTAPGYEDSEEYKVSDLANKDDIIIVLKKKKD